MRKLLMVVILLFLPLVCHAQVEVALSSQSLALGDTLAISVTAPNAQTLNYALYIEEKQINKSVDCAEFNASYHPQALGEYTLIVTAKDGTGQEETAQCTFVVTEDVSAALSLSPAAPRVGDAITLNVQAAGGTGTYAYRYEIFLNNTRIFNIESSSETFSYIPTAEGLLNARVTVTDGNGNTATDAQELTVAPGDGLSISGDTGAFYSKGGIHHWTVSAPDVWTARSDDTFITLTNTQGASGDVLTLATNACGNTPRQGQVFITAGGVTAAFKVYQTIDDGYEEEVYLIDEVGEFVRADGKEEITLINPQGQQSFLIDASIKWDIDVSVPWLHTDIDQRMLFITAQDNDTENDREGIVTLTAGDAQAHIYVFQTAPQQGASVLSVSLDALEGRAYQDTVSARVVTTPDTVALHVAFGQHEPLIYPITNAQETAENELYWTIDIPLVGSGEQTLLFSAQSEQGSAQKVTATLNIIQEAPDFPQSHATLTTVEDTHTLTVRTTSAATGFETLDAGGAVLQSIGREDAMLDAYIDKDNKGRYIDWTVPIIGDTLPGALRMGEKVIVVETLKAHDKTQDLQIFSQCDGTWADKKYRTSNLEHSGCAIFTLSHALTLLGYEGDAIRPEVLAKTYARCLVDGGTLNSTLIGNAGDDFGFRTRYKLYENKADITQKFSEGAVFSFSIVRGHIALAYEMSEDGTMIHIIDSAMSATFSRIQEESLYLKDEVSGAFLPITSLNQIPGATYYLNTNSYGGGSYWLRADYVIGRGVRLIQAKE